jgi:multidrug efflux pump subunit AcrA (membrane-fusion protein)
VSTSTPHERSPAVAQPLEKSWPSHPFGWSTGALAINALLAAGLVALGVYAYSTLGSSSASSAATRTATVQRGVVMTSVSASGSVESAGDVAANFQTSGTLTQLLVKQGQHVGKGQVLARVDSLSARQAVQEAEAGLATAQGRLQQTLDPLNAQEMQQLALSDAQAAESVRTATVSLSDAKAQASHDLSQAQTSVTHAKQQLASDKAQRTKDAKALADANATLAAAAAGSAAASSAQQKVTSAETTVAQDDSKIGSDETAVQTAVANVSATKLKNTQSVHSAENQVASAKLQQQSNTASNAVKTAPPKAGDLASAKASVLQAQIQLAQARKALNETTLRAPISGAVATVNGSVGDTVTGGSSSSSSSSNASSAASSTDSSSSSSSSSSLVTITGQNKLEVVAGFSEGDAASIAVGAAATAAISALPGVSLPAKVVAIDSTATTVSNVVTYNVTFALTGTNPKLKPGMTADVEVVTAEHDNALHVPTTAVTGSGANARVTVLRGGKQVVTTVVAGLKGDDATEVTSGLKAGDTVVLPTLTLSGLSSSSSASTTGAATRLRAAGLGGGGFGGP